MRIQQRDSVKLGAPQSLRNSRGGSEVRRRRVFAKYVAQWSEEDWTQVSPVGSAGIAATDRMVGDLLAGRAADVFPLGR